MFLGDFYGGQCPCFEARFFLSVYWIIDCLSESIFFVKSKGPVRREIGGWVSGDMANDGKSAAADSGIDIRPNWKSRRKSGKVNI